jgi:glutathionyl-hydroquinone reductase
MWYGLLPATTANSFKLNRYKIQGMESSFQMLKTIIYNKSVSREHNLANIKTSYSLKSR